MKDGKTVKLLILIIFLFSLLPLNIFLCSKGWYPNETMYMVGSIISAFCFFAGFCILGIYLVNRGNGKQRISIGGITVRDDFSKEKIDEDIVTLNKNFLLSFLKTSLALPFIIIMGVVGKTATEAEKAALYVFLIIVTIIIYLPVLFHLVRYIKVKNKIK